MPKKSAFSRIMYWAWPLLMIFIPTWIGNYVLPGEPAQRLWDPSEILLAWAPSILQLFAYSPGYCIGVGLVLGVCLYWWFRYSGLFYGALLFVASCMAGPTWPVLIKFWHYYAG